MRKGYASSLICGGCFFGLFCSMPLIFSHVGSDCIGSDPLGCVAGGQIKAKKALIFGTTGQDGSYLSELLLKKGYEVHGAIRRSSISNTGRIDHIIKDQDSLKKQTFFLHYGDVTDSGSVTQLIAAIQPDEVYNLSAQSHVAISFQAPEYTGNVDALGTLRILEAIRTLGMTHTTKFYQASTSELFGKVQETPQRETTPFYPRSPYAVAKLYAYWITINYREAYGMFVCNGILFNHESPRRGENFVTRKITLAVAEYARGEKTVLKLGNIDSYRDWGSAPDYVEAMWLMLQQDKPDDYVVATGEAHTVREFVECAYREIGVEIQWRGSGVDEVGFDKKTGAVVVKVDAAFYRPTEVEYLLGDPSKARRVLTWKPTTTFQALIETMVEADLKKG